MTADSYLVIRCDGTENLGGPCDEEWSHPVHVATHTELRRHLKARGWRRTRDGRDLCPDCARHA
ncbi:hypothetical protein ACWGLE_01295 [Streptomyces sp. NPDC055897]|uniref:hypothetical protein n=1 Tax=Streptomyces sp. NPDC002506 TaxID=3154536 RepID=UPI003326953B